MDHPSSKMASNLGFFAVCILLIFSQGCAQASPAPARTPDTSSHVTQSPSITQIPPTATQQKQQATTSTVELLPTATAFTSDLPAHFLARLNLGIIEKIAFSPGRDRLAAAGSSHICLLTTGNFEQIWCSPSELPPGFKIGMSPELSTQAIARSLAFHPSGELVAAALSNGFIVFIDTATGETANAINTNYPSIYKIEWSQDGSWIYEWSYEGGLVAWDAITGEKVRQLDNVTTKFGIALAWSADRSTLAFRSTERSITLLDLEANQPISTFDIQTPGEVYSLAFSPDGKNLYAGTATDGGCSGRCPEDESWVEGWNLTRGELIFTTDLSPDPKSSTDFMVSLAVSPDGRWLAGAGGYGRLMVFNATTGVLEAESRDVNPQVGMGWLDKDQLLFGLYRSNEYGDLSRKSIAILVMKTGDTTHLLLPGFEYIYSLAWMLDGERLVSNSAGGTVSIWQSSTGRRLDQFQLMLGDQPLNNFNQASISPVDGRLATPAEGSVAIVDIETRQVVRVMDRLETQAETRAFDIHWSPNGKILAGISSENYRLTLAVWDVSTGAVLLTIPMDFREHILSLALSPDGSQLAFGRNSQGTYRLVVWDVNQNEQVLSLDFPCTIRDLRWLTEDKILFIGAEGAEIWDLKQSRQIRNINQAYSINLTLSPDGRLAASTSSQEGILLWDFQTGEELAHFKADSARISELAFNSDGSLLFSLNDGGSAVIWDMSEFTSR